ncbi:hypothetical protein [Haloarchaeobius sp. TZWSO28]|uniref:hypothetical protein n=1 Tax=Haloarchaeobius sp. TZWSO28 TaxID=3446119 RepID=UPI003EB80B6D
MPTNDDQPAETFEATVAVPDRVVEDVESELLELGRARDSQAFYDLLYKKLKLKFTGLPDYCKQ